MVVLAELAICLVVYVFFSRDYGGMSCLSYMRMAIWNNCIFFFPSPSLFLGKKLFPCFGGAFGTGLLLLLSFYLMFRLFFLLRSD